MMYLKFLIGLSFLFLTLNANPILIEDEETDYKHPYGKPINVMKFDENEEVIIDEQSLNDTFMHPDVRHRKIVAISIIGAFRKGKSFLMDYALRYMYANYKSIAFPNNPLSDKRNWIGDHEEPLKGFSWRGGTSRDTTGIVLWSDVFLHDLKDPKTKKIEKIAIILMDTQGLFDTKTSPTDNSRIFALGTLISSVQIFNLNNLIQENQLEYLQMATDFARFAMKKNRQINRSARNYKPFQTLVFLMRDWQNQDEYEYGLAGGATYLASVLNIEPNQPQALQDVRRFITESFESRNCFLLPYPGPQISDKTYDGRFSMLGEDFQIQLKDFLIWLLEPKNLKKKKILNSEVNGIEYLEYLKAYFEAFQSNEIPKVDTLHGITVRKQFDIIILEAFTEYKNQLRPVQFKENGQTKELNAVEQEINEMNDKASETAIKIFKGKKKLGSERDEKKFESELRNQMETYFNDWKKLTLESYQNIKTVEDKKNEELRILNEQKEEELRKYQEEAEKKRKAMEEEHQNQAIIFNSTISELQANTANQIQNLTLEHAKYIEEAEREMKRIFNQLEEEKIQIKKKAEETEQYYKAELAKIEDSIKKQKEDAGKKINDGVNERLEALRLQAEERRLQHEIEIKIAERREQAIADQRKFEREQFEERRRIQEAAAREERREREKADREQKEAFRMYQQQLTELRIQAQREEKEARERSDRQMQMMMEKINAQTKGDLGSGNTLALIGGIAAATFLLG